MPKKKNLAAVSLAKLRPKRLSKEKRSDVARAGARDRNLRLSPNERRDIARKAGLAGGPGRKEKRVAMSFGVGPGPKLTRQSFPLRLQRP
jgi:hypothetical protein